MFALFEFAAEGSLEVGLVNWIEEVEGNAFPKNCDPQILVDKTVTVAWPKNSQKSKEKAGPLSRPTPSSRVYAARVLAVNENKLKLMAKMNRLCDGDDQALETDLETGRGKRRKRPRKISSSSSSDEEPEEPLQKKKERKTLKQTKISQMASNLRKQLEEETKISQVKDLPSQETKIDLLKLECQMLRGENERLREQLKFLKDIPESLKRIECFMSSTDSSQSQMASSSRESIESSELTSPKPSPSCKLLSSPNSSSRENMVSLSQDIRLPAGVIRKCVSKDASKTAVNLLTAVFGRELLAESSLTGAANSKKESKPALDKGKVATIIEFVMKRHESATEREIKQALTNKLSNEAKRKKRSLAVSEFQDDYD